MSALSPWHLLIIAVVVAALFGGRRLPGAARGLARSMRVFKSELAGSGAATATPEADVAEKTGETTELEGPNAAVAEPDGEPVRDVKSLAEQWGSKNPPMGA